MPPKLTQEEFERKVYENNPDVKRVGRYKENKVGVVVKMEYGYCRVNPSSLLSGCCPSVNVALDKDSYFKNKLRSIHNGYKKAKFNIVGKYKSYKEPLKVIDKYGIYYITPKSLIQGSSPCSQNAACKTTYFINKFKEVWGDEYSYESFKYINGKNKKLYRITCGHHGEFKQTINDHLNGRGCSKCSPNYHGWSYSKWKKAAKESKNFDSFKVYVVHCKDNFESFYKIGKTFQKVKKRLSDCWFPYDYEKVLEISSNDHVLISDLEVELHNHHKKYSYTPLNDFRGQTECFSELDMNYINNIEV